MRSKVPDSPSSKYAMTNGFQSITVISDPVEIDSRRSLLDAVVESPLLLRQDWLHQKKWAAVPVFSTGDIGTSEAEKLVRAVTKFGCHQCYAVVPVRGALHSEALPVCFDVPVMSQTVVEVSFALRWNNYVLFPQELTFVVQSTHEDYRVIAGTREFVEIAVGTGISDARQAWIRFANDASWSEGMRKAYQFISERYASFNGA